MTPLTPLVLQAAARRRTPLRVQDLAVPTRTAIVLPVAVTPTGRMWAGVWRSMAGGLAAEQQTVDPERPRWRVVETLPAVPPLALAGRRIVVGWGGLSPEAAAEALALAGWYKELGVTLAIRYDRGSTPGAWRTVTVTRLEGLTVKTVSPRGHRRLRLDAISGVGELALAWSGTEYVPPAALGRTA